MLLSIKVPDEIYEAYGQHNPQNPRLAIEQAVSRWAKVTPNKKAIILTGKDLTELQDMLTGIFESPEDLIPALRKALKVKVEGVEVELSESQRKALQDSCKYFGMEPTEFAVYKIKEGLRLAFGV